VQRQASAALDAGHEVDVVCLRHPGEPPRETVEGVEVHRLPISHDRTAGPARMATEYLAFLVLATATVARLHRRRRYDVVHVSNPPDLLIIAGLVPRLTGARLVFDVHDLTPDLFAWRFSGSRLKRLVVWALELQERMAVRLADTLMTVHDGCAHVLAERSARSGQDIVIVMNTFDERLLPAVAASRTVAWHRPVRLVYHGSLTRLYGVHTLVEAFAMSGLAGQARLMIIGDGDERPILERQAADLGVAADVEFSRGFVPIREALERVSECDIGAVPFDDLPINRFSLPSKLFEYIALGLPVVCARTATIARHFDDDELFFFRPGDPHELARRLKEVVESPVEARVRIEKARLRYESYRWDRNKDRFLDVIGTSRRRGTKARG
jgi:glycosyltransferase involved in cell wall biosynthesis